MDSELTQEQNDERIKLVMEIMCLAYLFQQVSDHAVFIDYSGHVDSLRIEVVESKDRWQEKLAETQFYTADRFEKNRNSEDPNVWLKVKRDVLRNSLENRGIDYEPMIKVATAVYHYEF